MKKSKLIRPHQNGKVLFFERQWYEDEKEATIWEKIFAKSYI